MNREIKFRAWSKKEKRWVFMTLYKDSTVCTWEDGTQNGEEAEDLDLQGWLQYTGLKDKNGKEIYESDILEIDEDGRKMFDAVGSDGSGVAKYQVVGWKDGSWMTNRNLERLYGENTYLWILLPTCTIIGNIYENPECLK